jgi:hypothetical protein
MNTTRKLHDETVQRLANDYKARGFKVSVEPTADALPPFLKDYQPDLIAIGPNECVVVEVKVGTDLAHGSRLRPIVERIAKEPGWRFSLVVIDETGTEQSLAEKMLIAEPQVGDRIQEARVLLNQNMLHASFLLLWSALEGALRNLAERANLPLGQVPTSALLRELFSAGELSRVQFDSAMYALSLRNNVAHGFGSVLTQQDVEKLMTLAEELLRELHGEQQS